jgi:hypothetical protein
MSFILDALKKSENDRQRQTGPALFEVKVAPPKAGFPIWAIAIVALLAVNMVIVGWMLLRRSTRGDEAAPAPAPAASQPAPTQGPSSGTGSSLVATVPPPTNTQAPGAQENTPPSMSRLPANMSRGESQDSTQGRMADRDQREPTLGGTAGGAGAGGARGDGRYGGADGMDRGAAGATRPTGEGAGAGGAREANDGVGRTGPRGSEGAGGSENAGRSAAARGNGASAANNEAEGGGGNPDDYAPAQEDQGSLFKGHVKRGTASGLMLYQDLAVANGSNLPELRLDMHVYDPKPQNRFALINMHRMREGESIKDVRVEAITPEGVVMSHNGTKFLLPRE